MGGVLCKLGLSAFADGATMSFISVTAQGGFKAGIKQGIIGGITAGLTKGLADKIGHGHSPGPVVGQMILHGAISELKGGKFKHGAIAALASKVGSHYSQSYFGEMGTGTQRDLFGRTAVAMMFGGLASEASGGSFEDGAMSALFVHLFNDAAYPKCSWVGQFNCTHNPLKDPPLFETSSSHRSLTGELEAGFQKSNNETKFAVGLSAEATFMLPGIEVGTIGLNLQIGGGVTGLYFYRPAWSEHRQEGFGLGGSLELNIAAGSGSWTEEFLNDSVSVLALGGSHFYSSGWQGLSLGLSAGLPIGAHHTETYYHLLPPFKE